jgi:long-subunit acyl-CoA synthetase (AMP-forming)
MRPHVNVYDDLLANARPADTAIISRRESMTYGAFVGMAEGIGATLRIVKYLALARDDRMMVLLPFDYCFGLSLLCTHLRVGGTLVRNNASQFAEDVLNDLARFAYTGFAGVPAIYQQFLRRSSLAQVLKCALPA